MIARNNIENITGIQEFDIESAIIPNKGSGGITFNNSISDFNSVLTANMFNNHKTKIKSEINSKYMYLKLMSEKDEFEVNIDLLTGKINSLVCNIGYKGKLLNNIGIGSKMSELLQADNTISFDLDHSFYARYPFDGLIIYAPNKISEKIFNGKVYNSSIPDFKIETIAILEMGFAEKSFEGTIFY